MLFVWNARNEVKSCSLMLQYIDVPFQKSAWRECGSWLLLSSPTMLLPKQDTVANTKFRLRRHTCAHSLNLALQGQILRSLPFMMPRNQAPIQQFMSSKSHCNFVMNERLPILIEIVSGHPHVLLHGSKTCKDLGPRPNSILTICT